MNGTDEEASRLNEEEEEEDAAQVKGTAPSPPKAPPRRCKSLVARLQGGTGRNRSR